MQGRHFKFQLVPAGRWRRLSDTGYDVGANFKAHGHFVPTSSKGDAYAIYRKLAEVAGIKMFAVGVSGFFLDTDDREILALRVEDETILVADALQSVDRAAELSWADASRLMGTTAAGEETRAG